MKHCFQDINMTLNDVLFIRHIPGCLSESDTEDFLKHMGAVKVSVFKSKFKKHTAFATLVSIAYTSCEKFQHRVTRLNFFLRFQNEYAATECMHRLHQKDLLGSKLVVEFAKNHQPCSNESNQNIP